MQRKEQQASLTVKYQMEVIRDVETEGSTISFGFGSGGHHSSIGMGFIFPVGETYTVDRLVLTIDLVENKTRKLVWRGSLSYRLDVASTPEAYTHMVNELVTEILRDYPPK